MFLHPLLIILDMPVDHLRPMIPTATSATHPLQTTARQETHHAFLSLRFAAALRPFATLAPSTRRSPFAPPLAPPALRAARACADGPVGDAAGDAPGRYERSVAARVRRRGGERRGARLRRAVPSGGEGSGEGARSRVARRGGLAGCCLGAGDSCFGRGLDGCAARRAFGGGFGAWLRGGGENFCTALILPCLAFRKRLGGADDGAAAGWTAGLSVASSGALQRLAMSKWACFVVFG